MCGIIGYCGDEHSVSRLIAGLKTLEYRGYDSAGISVFSEDGIFTVKSAGRIENIEKKLQKEYADPLSHCGIGHTRWATHGKPDDINAHPHCTEHVCVVHNGMIENYIPLREEFIKQGCCFRSETDSEIIAVLIDFAYMHSHDAMAAIRYAQNRLIGSFACAVIFADQKDKIYAFRRDSPLIAAQTREGNYIASDFSAVSRYTDGYYVPDEGEILVMDREQIKIYDKENREPTKKRICVMQEQCDNEKGEFPHFMIKEIFDAPAAVNRTCSAYIREQLPFFSCGDLNRILMHASRIHMTACGTALNAGKIGKFFFEQLAKIPVSYDIASEFRYNPPLTGTGEAAVFITQSGETADTLAALRRMKQQGIQTIAIVNTPNSSAAREADCVLYTKAGTEIAVASTKAYVAQCSLLYLMAVSAGLQRGLLTEHEAKEKTNGLLTHVPEWIANILADKDSIRALSSLYCSGHSCFFIGRGADYFLAEESSLKLKEVSYVHSEAYAAGELKHGTIALIEEDTPVIAIASGDVTYDKTLCNIREVKARGAKVLLVTDRNIGMHPDVADHIYTVACKHKELFPICAAVFFQLLAYYAAVLGGRDVDKPRNLAKSVTVE